MIDGEKFKLHMYKDIITGKSYVSGIGIGYPTVAKEQTFIVVNGQVYINQAALKSAEIKI